jgi:hypothetical protein
MFLRDYQLRPSAGAVLLRNFSSTVGGPVTEITTDVLHATIRLSTARCFPGQEIAMGVKVWLNPGWHVYGTSVPNNYQAQTLTLTAQ